MVPMWFYEVNGRYKPIQKRRLETDLDWVYAEDVVALRDSPKSGLRKWSNDRWS